MGRSHGDGGDGHGRGAGEGRRGVGVPAGQGRVGGGVAHLLAPRVGSCLASLLGLSWFANGNRWVK